MAGSRNLVRVALLVVAILFAGKMVYAQKPGGMTPPAQPPTTTTTPLGENTKQPVETGPSKQETKAIKAFRNTPETDADKKTQLGEEFIDKYPLSVYRPEVVSWLAQAYMMKGQVDKFQSEGDKELALKDPSPISLAALGSDLSRVVNANTPDEQKHLDQADQLCKKSLEVLATVKKPEGESDEKFNAAKNQTASLAHSGIGTVLFRRGKYADSIPEFQEAVKLNNGADPVNYYLLGKANEVQNNFDQALDAYTKCAAMTSGMQAACNASIKDVKAHGAVLPKQQ